MSQPIFTIDKVHIRLSVANEMMRLITTSGDPTSGGIHWGYHSPEYVADYLTINPKLYPNGEIDLSLVVNRLKSLYCHKMGADANVSLKRIGRTLKSFRNKYEPINRPSKQYK